MKRFLTVVAAMLALTGSGQVAMRALEDLTNTNLVCVTDYGPQVVSLTQRVTGLEGNTNVWNTAYGWGNHAGLYREIGWVPSWTDVTDKPDLFDWSYDSLTDVPTTFPPEAHRHDYTAITNAPWLTEYTEQDEIALAALYGTNTILEAAITNEAALRTAHTEDTGNPHDVTAAQIGAITVERDLAALRAYHYGSPDIVESPAEWFVFDGSGTITAFNWKAGRTNVVIPWAIGGVPVTAIGPVAFQMSGIVSLIAPQTVTTIGDRAFDSCTALTSVTIPHATSIGINAFYGCSLLASINLPQATSIGGDAFSGCELLTSVNLPQATMIGGYAFYYCSLLASINLPQVTSIGDYAFYNCSLLASINLPQVTSIGINAFCYCELLTSVIAPHATSIGINAFYGCSLLASINLPQATSIGDYAFYGCSALTSVHMGQNAPAKAASVFASITPPPKVYVTNPQATGWGATWNGATVVRMPLYADAIYQAGELVATTGHVAQAIADKVDVTSGTATNLTTAGWLQLPQTAATNLVLRMWASNDVIYASEVYQ